MEFDSTKFKSSASFFFAKKCLSFCLDEDAFYSLYYLFKAYFDGHLCIYFDGKSLNPDPRLLLDEEEKIDEEKIINGFSFFLMRSTKQAQVRFHLSQLLKRETITMCKEIFFLKSLFWQMFKDFMEKHPLSFFLKRGLSKCLSP